MSAPLPSDFTDRDSRFLMAKLAAVPKAKNLTDTETERIVAIARRLQRLADRAKDGP